MACVAEPKVFTLYWANGKKTELYGENFNHATSSAGLGVSPIAGLDFYREGNDDTYGWNPIQACWEVHDLHYSGYDT